VNRGQREDALQSDRFTTPIFGTDVQRREGSPVLLSIVVYTRDLSGDFLKKMLVVAFLGLRKNTT